VRLLFGKLDAYIRQRVGRYLARLRSTSDRRANLSCTTEYLLRELRLRSLVEIYDGLKPAPIRKPSAKFPDSTVPAFALSRTEELLVQQNKLLKELLAAQLDSQQLLAGW